MPFSLTDKEYNDRVIAAALNLLGGEAIGHLDVVPVAPDEGIVPMDGDNAASIAANRILGRALRAGGEPVRFRLPLADASGRDDIRRLLGPDSVVEGGGLLVELLARRVDEDNVGAL